MSGFETKHLNVCDAHHTQKKHPFTNVCVWLVCVQTAALHSPNVPPRLLLGPLSHE